MSTRRSLPICSNHPARTPSAGKQLELKRDMPSCSKPTLFFSLIKSLRRPAMLRPTPRDPNPHLKRIIGRTIANRCQDIGTPPTPRVTVNFDRVTETSVDHACSFNFRVYLLL